MPVAILDAVSLPPQDTSQPELLLGLCKMHGTHYATAVCSCASHALAVTHFLLYIRHFRQYFRKLFYNFCISYHSDTYGMSDKVPSNTPSQL